MDKSGVFEYNKEFIYKYLDDAVAMLGENYKVTQLPAGEFEAMPCGKLDFHIKHYDIENFGHLQTMNTAESKEMQLATFVITPFDKNLPLISHDFLFIGETRMFIMEVYALVDKRDETFELYLDKFRKVFESKPDIPDMPLKPNWYDDIRPLYVGKKVKTMDNDNDLVELFRKGMDVYQSMEKELPFLNEEEAKVKYDITLEYVDKLVSLGGASTDVWKKQKGEEYVDRFFHEVFFGVTKAIQ